MQKLPSWVSPHREGIDHGASWEALKLRYRFVVLDGKPDRKLLDHLWDDSRNPPAVDVRLLASP